VCCGAGQDVAELISDWLAASHEVRSARIDYVFGILGVSDDLRQDAFDRVGDGDEMVRALLDSMIFDAILADPQLKAGVLKVISTGDLVIVSTHVQEDQLANIPNQTKRDAIASIPRTKLPTGAAVWFGAAFGLSLGKARSWCLNSFPRIAPSDQSRQKDRLQRI
jgi:hypothetical protein